MLRIAWILGMTYSIQAPAPGDLTELQLGFQQPKATSRVTLPLELQADKAQGGQMNLSFVPANT